MIKNGKLAIILFSFILVFVLNFYFSKNPSDREERIFLIERGENMFEIGAGLQEEGIISHRLFFNAYVFLKGKVNRLQAGQYLLAPSMSISEVAGKITRGDSAKSVITIPEGWSLRDIGRYFEDKGMFRSEELFELAGSPLANYAVSNLPYPKDFSPDYDFLEDKPKNVSLEGYLFPDTYEVVYGAGLESIVRKMLDNFDRKLSQEIRDEIEKQGKSVFEIVTMASMIEKEVRDFSDKKIVSGILWKRLENGIGLQVDATVTYITGKKSVKVSKDDTETDSLYNTYKYRGLPLGPISNPGLESILAALYPESSDYWYYLSALDGTTIFSETLNEHNAAKAQHL